MVSQLSEIWSEFSTQDPDPGSGSWLFTHPGSWSCIPDPKSRGQKGTGALIPDPGSGFATLEFFGFAQHSKKNSDVIKLDIAPMSFPPGQYLLVSASNNMLYYLSQWSQWDKIRTTCVVNLMSQDTKFWLLKINCAKIRTYNLQDNTLILYLCATFTLFKFVQIGYLNS